MKEKYLCVSCNRTFAVGDAVDGFGQGYRKGFLCPFCNANLRDAGESDDVLNLRFGIIYFLSMIIVFLVDRAEVFQVRITANAQINDLFTFILLIAIPTVPFLIVNWRSVFGTRTIYTRRIHNQ